MSPVVPGEKASPSEAMPVVPGEKASPAEAMPVVPGAETHPRALVSLRWPVLVHRVVGAEAQTPMVALKQLESGAGRMSGRYKRVVQHKSPLLGPMQVSLITLTS